jgi:hypothetical protein
LAYCRAKVNINFIFLKELSRFGKQEDWVIADEATTTTALPSKFSTAVNSIMISLFGVVQPDDVSPKRIQIELIFGGKTH